jgi:tRNA threonylcarbamoyladenosine biosynthesis protein TsaE
MTIKKIRIADLQDINRAAEEFIQYISESDAQSNIFAFYGHMGAGKTTFVTAICKALGVEDTVNSPTFTIVNEYRAAKGFPIYHFDFYRINKLQEAYEIGIDEYFGGDGLCLIEWPEKIEELLPEDIIKVTVTPQEDGSREVEIFA